MGWNLRASANSLALPGHNLFTTTYVLSEGTSSEGYYYIGRGFGDVAMVATSPWVWLNYNMLNADVKFALALDENGNRLSVEAAGFKSYKVRWAAYEQESVFLRSTFSSKFARRAAPANLAHDRRTDTPDNQARE